MCSKRRPSLCCSSRSSSEGASCPRGRPVTRKLATDRICWELATLSEVSKINSSSSPKSQLAGERRARCHVCDEWLPPKPPFRMPSGRYVRRDPLFNHYWVCSTCVEDCEPPSSRLDSRRVFAPNGFAPLDEVESIMQRSNSTPGLRFVDPSAPSVGTAKQQKPGMSAISSAKASGGISPAGWGLACAGRACTYGILWLVRFAASPCVHRPQPSRSARPQRSRYLQA